MMKKSDILRTAAIAAGVLVMVGTAGAALADTEGDVTVDVQIPPLVQPGELALTVAPGGVTLTEDGSTADWRQFTGVLPEVTVTDTRLDGEVPEGAFWYVVGTASDFVGDAGQPVLDAGYLGWTPRLVSETESGLVAEGDPVETVLDEGPNAVGLVDQELLVSTADSAAVREEGSWTAAADLFLRTPVDVAPGGYSSMLTLSLFE
ncbi:hypothetical protein DEU34_2590 [Microbacterium sp. AG1240]|uniref:hypothetical protein n=1 Tax=Microbacterium sp. AG1240 TaxID=2183992 RepID=UPI000F25FF5B|nr:hypothetical protein [Microbacterium sp. AG1240]RKT31520.1 hypothetical protein DEU34_2590 [Microbacterium sp. AG1240]